MSSPRRTVLTVLFLLLAASSRLGAEEFVVKTISATVGGPSTFLVASEKASKREQIVSSSTLIQNALLPALLSGAKLEQLVLVPGSNVIARVYAFALVEGPSPIFYGDYEVSRIATQRKPNGTGEHLEAFLKKIGEKEEKTYNVYDPSLQQLLIAAFSAKAYIKPPNVPRVDVQFDGDEIVTVTLGEKYQSGSK